MAGSAGSAGPGRPRRRASLEKGRAAPTLLDHPNGRPSQSRALLVVIAVGRKPLWIVQILLVLLPGADAKGGGALEVRAQALIPFTPIDVPDCLDQVGEPAVGRRPPAEVG